MELSLAELNIVAYYFVLTGRTFTSDNVRLDFLPPIAESVGTGKVGITKNNGNGKTVDFRIISKKDGYYITMDTEDYKITEE